MNAQVSALRSHRGSVGFSVNNSCCVARSSPDSRRLLSAVYKGIRYPFFCFLSTLQVALRARRHPEERVATEGAGYAVQSSTFRSEIRPKSERFWERSVPPFDKTIAAILRSRLPMRGCSFRKR